MVAGAFYRLVDRAVIRQVNRRVSFAGVAPLRERPAADLAEFVLATDPMRFRLPAGPPLQALRFSARSAAPLGDEATDRLTGTVLRPRGRPIAAALLVSGWMARAEGYFRWLGRRLARDGVLVAVLDLPAHGVRRPPGTKNGQRFLTGDLFLSVAHLRQALADARSLLRSLGDEVVPGTPVLACGFSLGAWVCGTAASLEPGAGAVLVTPAVDPAALIASSALLAGARRALGVSGFDLAQLQREARPLALNFRSRPTGGALLIAGQHDLVIPEHQVRDLEAAWSVPLQFFPCGHMTPYISRVLIARLHAALTGGGVGGGQDDEMLLAARVRLRRLQPQDSMTELTGLLHRAYGALAAKGFRFYASHQDDQATRERAAKGECYVGVQDGRIVSTITLADAEKTDGSPWYERAEVASVGQFAVEPELQRRGIGSAMMDFVEARARKKGVKELALDTAEGATELIEFYRKRGYRFIENAQWSVTNYRSAVYSKTLIR